jgi:outer membrane protein TolC
MNITTKKVSNRLKYFLFLFISICFNVLLCISIYPQDSLSTYLTLASKNNPLVLQKYYEYQAALQRVTQVGSLPDPELNIGVFLSPMELISGNQVADMRLMQMFPWFGVLKNAKDEMSLMAKAKFESFRNAKIQAYYDVQQTWYELYKTSQEIRISEKNLHILRTIERLALVRFGTASTGKGEITSSPAKSVSTLQTQGASPGSVGMETMAENSDAISNQSSSGMKGNSMDNSPGGSGLIDIYRIQIEAGELENSIALLKNQFNTTTVLFNTYLNRPIHTTIAITDSLKPDTLGISLLSISDSMLISNPMLGMLKYEEQSFDARKKMITRMGYPMLGLGVDYSLINKSEMSTSVMNGRDMIMPMIEITLPIYRKKYKAMKMEADFLKSAAIQNYSSSANSLQVKYNQALQLYLDAQRRVNLYKKQYSIANKTLDIMLKSFATSGSALTELLRLRQQTLEYEYKQVEAVVDFNTAIASLRHLMASTLNP